MVPSGPRGIGWAVLLLALALRLWGIGFGLPHVYHQDEPIVVNYAMSIGVTGWNTGLYLPPQMAGYFLFVIYAAFFVMGRIAGFFASPDAFAVQYLSDPTPFYLLGRLFLGVLPALLTVYVLMLIGRRNLKLGILPALFLALLPMHVQHSHYIYVDVIMTCFAAAMFYHLISWIQSAKARSAVWAALFFGLAVSAKYTAVYFLPAVIMSHFLVPGRKAVSGENIRDLLKFGAISVAAYAVVSPFTFLDWPNFVRQVIHQSGARGYAGWTHHLTYSLMHGTGFLLVPLAFAGFFRLLREFRKETLLLALSVVFYYAVNVCFSQPFPRYMMPILPILCLLAAAGWREAASRIRLRGLRFFFGTVFLASLVVPALYSDWLFTRTDTRTQCLEWMDKNTPEGSVVAVDNKFFSPRLVLTQALLQKKYEALQDPARNALIKSTDWAAQSESQKRKLDLLARANRDKKTYNVFVLSSAEKKSPTRFLFEGPFVEAGWGPIRKIGADYLIFNSMDEEASVRAFKEKMGREARLIAVFNPYRSKDRTAPLDSLDKTAAPHGLHELFSRLFPGPYLEVYKIT